MSLSPTVRVAALPALVLVHALGCAGGERPPPLAPATCPTLAPLVAEKPPAPPAAVAPAAPPPLTEGVVVTVKNPLPASRARETVSVRLADAQQAFSALHAEKAVVQDATGALVLSQLVDVDADGKPDELVFQTDLAGGETKAFLLGEGTRSIAAREQFRVYGRFVRERHDDFAWENDRTAHRMYGPDLETWKQDPLTSSGIDVWVKRTPHLVINEWYQSDDYHRDNGDGADFYSVGPSRGCGGIGVWDGKALHVSRNFTSSRVLANGPIRLIFELTYAPWDVGAGVKVAETKRVIVDAGQHFDRFESSFKVTGKAGALTLAIGVAKHPGGVFEADQPGGTLRTWEPLSAGNGQLGCAVVSAAAAGFAETTTDRLLLTALTATAPAVYLAGSAWDKSGNLSDEATWLAWVKGAGNALRSPPVVSLSASKRQP